MSRCHLSCVWCRIRLDGSAPEIDLLEGACPICGTSLGQAPSGAGVMGFRLFDLAVLRDQESSEPRNAAGRPADFVARRAAVAARDDEDAGRWLDEGGSFSSEAVAEWRAGR
jgi:hypothetical protein